jgi:hypothetical protein
MKTSNLLFMCAGILSGIGCTSRSTEDRIAQDAAARQEAFYATAPYGPSNSVVVMADVPRGQMSGGSIVITNGRQPIMIEPHAWRDHTGVAVNYVEAEQEVNEARKIHDAQAELANAVKELRELVDHEVKQKAESDSKASP